MSGPCVRCVRRARMLAVVPLLSALVLVAGCALQHRAPDRTGGIRLDLLVELGDDSAARYLVETDGTLHFGGGWAATSDEFTWSGALTDEEIARLAELLALHRWFSADPRSTGVPAERTVTVELRSQHGERRFKVKGDSPDVTPIYDLLATAALRRFDPVLRTLPRPE